MITRHEDSPTSGYAPSSGPSWKHCLRRVYAGVGQTLKVVLFDHCISVGVDRMQRNFEPMRKQMEAWQRNELTDVTAKVVIYAAFVEGKLEAPKHLARAVHDLYFESKYEEFADHLEFSNAFTSAFKELDPIPQFKATAKLGEFLEVRFSQRSNLRRYRTGRRSFFG